MPSTFALRSSHRQSPPNTSGYSVFVIGGSPAQLLQRRLPVLDTILAGRGQVLGQSSPRFSAHSSPGGRGGAAARAERADWRRRNRWRRRLATARTSRRSRRSSQTSRVSGPPIRRSAPGRLTDAPPRDMSLAPTLAGVPPTSASGLRAWATDLQRRERPGSVSEFRAPNAPRHEASVVDAAADDLGRQTRTPRMSRAPAVGDPQHARGGARKTNWHSLCRCHVGDATG